MNNNYNLTLFVLYLRIQIVGLAFVKYQTPLPIKDRLKKNQTSEQTKYLEQQYKANPILTKLRLLDIANKAVLSRSHVRKWWAEKRGASASASASASTSASESQASTSPTSPDAAPTKEAKKSKEKAPKKPKESSSSNATATPPTTNTSENTPNLQ